MNAKEYKNKDDDYEIVGGGNYLKDLKKINIFVGANNSGKSRFLRQIFGGSVDDFVFFDDFNNKLISIFEKLQPKFHSLYFMRDLEEILKSRTGNYIDRFNSFCDKIEAMKSRSSGTNNVWDIDVAESIKLEMKNLNIYEKISNNENIKRKNIYVPILRGLRHLDYHSDINNKEDVYKKRTNADYKMNIDDSENMDIFSGLSIYTEIKKMLLGSKADRDFITSFENFLSDSFFEQKSVTLIPDYNLDILKININNEEDREIFNVGDGIQSIIINTFQAFKYQNENTLICIEEPEMMMHPSIQRVLIETLVTKFNKAQIFLTTHSNHFLDLTYDYPDDISIFSFEAIDSGKFKIKNISNNVEILDLLGVRNSSVFLSNCVIWTEGVTDRMLLRKLFQIKNINYKEDYNYSFAEYGGNNLENFDFIDDNQSNALNVSAISKTNYIIADNDNITGIKNGDTENTKYLRRNKIKQVLGSNNFFDGYIEIENLIPYKIWVEVIKKILIDKPKKPIEFNENINDNNVEEIFNNELNNKKIGYLLKKYLIKVKENENEPKYFKSEGVQCLGEDKKLIMEHVVRVIDDLDIKLNDFPEVVLTLINSLVSFISNSNK